MTIEDAFVGELMTPFLIIFESSSMECWHLVVLCSSTTPSKSPSSTFFSRSSGCWKDRGR